MNIKGKYPLFQSGGVLGGISKLLQGLGAEAKETLSTLLQEVVLALVLPDLHQIVLPPPPSLVRVNPRLVRLLPHFRARVAGPQRHCEFPFRWPPGSARARYCSALLCKRSGKWRREEQRGRSEMDIKKRRVGRVEGRILGS